MTSSILHRYYIYTVFLLNLQQNENKSLLYIEPSDRLVDLMTCVVYLRIYLFI